MIYDRPRKKYETAREWLEQEDYKEREEDVS